MPRCGSSMLQVITIAAQVRRCAYSTVARPRKAKKPTISVMVVSTTDPARAGSMPRRFMGIGSRAPALAAITGMLVCTPLHRQTLLDSGLINTAMAVLVAESATLSSELVAAGACLLASVAYVFAHEGATVDTTHVDVFDAQVGVDLLMKLAGRDGDPHDARRRVWLAAARLVAAPGIGGAVTRALQPDMDSLLELAGREPLLAVPLLTALAAAPEVDDVVRRRSIVRPLLALVAEAGREQQGAVATALDGLRAAVYAEAWAMGEVPPTGEWAAYFGFLHRAAPIEADFEAEKRARRLRRDARRAQLPNRTATPSARTLPATARIASMVARALPDMHTMLAGPLCPWQIERRLISLWALLDE